MAIFLTTLAANNTAKGVRRFLLLNQFSESSANKSSNFYFKIFK